MNPRRPLAAAIAIATTAAAAHASPIFFRFDTIADTEVNGVVRTNAPTVLTMKGLTGDIDETFDSVGRRLTMPVGISMTIDHDKEVLFATSLRLYAYPDIGLLGVVTPFNLVPFSFLSHEAVGFELDSDLPPIAMLNASSNPIIVVHVSTGLMVFLAMHSGVFSAEAAMPAPGSSTPMILAALVAARRRRPARRTLG